MTTNNQSATQLAILTVCVPHPTPTQASQYYFLYALHLNHTLCNAVTARASNCHLGTNKVFLNMNFNLLSHHNVV